MVLDEIAEREEEVLQAVTGAAGTEQERYDGLSRQGIFEQYRDIHEAYVVCLDAPVLAPEALKRALFIQWYAVVEPGCKTGILELDLGSESRVFASLNKVVGTEEFDPELLWMLPWYYHVADVPFDAHDDIPILKKWLRQHPHAQFPRPPPPATRFESRGQMGRYWVKLLYP